MSKFMHIMVTITKDNHNSAHLYYADDEAGVEINTHVSYKDGMEQLRKLEKLLNKPAQLVINQFDHTIAYKDLHGIIRRE